MNIDLSTARRSKTEIVRLGDQHFTVDVSVPTFADKLRDSELLVFEKEARGEWIAHRLRSTITGWGELYDQVGEPIRFTWEHLVAFCEQSDEVYHALVRLAHDAYADLAEDKKKN